MYPDIKNRVAIITGSAEGIGLAIAESLLRSGGKVILNDIDGPQLTATLYRLNNQYGNRVVACAGDAGDIETIERMVDMAVTHFNGIDFVVANAGVTLFGDFFEFTTQDFQKIVDLHLRGTFFLVQKTTKIIREQGRGGRIILMTSNIGIQAYPNLTAYSMTKAALAMMARSLVLDLAPHKININAVAPGATLTERTKNEQPDYEGVWKKLIPKGNIAKPSDIAKTCLFLLSEHAAHINGETIVVDGGWTVTSKYPEGLC